MEPVEEETRSRFLFRNLVRGLMWFAVIITVFILLEEYIQENFQARVEQIYDSLFLFYGVFTLSEIIFGLIPPEFFMYVYVLNHIPLHNYIIDLSALTIISYGAGVVGYYVGRNFSKTGFFEKISEKYLGQYQNSLRKYGGYLVLVGAVTPIPFSAMCMLAGSINFPLRSFLLISIARVLRFAVYGWMVWSFPNYFNG
ncbi:MAG TPA: VTT domain-containing protein [Cyclobacteriaceae bacterium]|nr:VTT domain-containing protein [Cyclobacteriaceae bacterium]